MKSTRKNLVQLLGAATLAAATGFVYGQAVITPSSGDEGAPASVEQIEQFEGAAQSAPAGTEVKDVGGTVAPEMGGAVTGGSQEEPSAFPEQIPDEVDD